MSIPRVAICVPSMGTWMADMALDYGALIAYSTQLGISVCASSVQASLVSYARNQLVLGAFENGATHILWWDSDNTAPRDGLERLLRHNKDVVGGLYPMKLPPYRTVGRLIGDPDVSGGGLHKANLMPHGFCLVKTSVYRKIEAPWYFETYEKQADKGGLIALVGEDTNFTHKCLEAGIDVYADMDLTFEIGHIGPNNVSCDRPAPRS